MLVEKRMKFWLAAHAFIFIVEACDLAAMGSAKEEEEEKETGDFSLSGVDHPIVFAYLPHKSLGEPIVWPHCIDLLKSPWMQSLSCLLPLAISLALLMIKSQDQ